MARNRKNSGSGLRAGPLIIACSLCLVIGGAGVGYVWQKAVISQLGRERQKLEAHLSALQSRNKVAREQLAASQSPPMLEMRIKELNLGLVPPQPSQVLRLVEPAGSSAAPEVGSPSQYMAMESTGRAGMPPNKERRF